MTGQSNSIQNQISGTSIQILADVSVRLRGHRIDEKDGETDGRGTSSTARTVDVQLHKEEDYDMGWPSDSEDHLLLHFTSDSGSHWSLLARLEQNTSAV